MLKRLYASASAYILKSGLIVASGATLFVGYEIVTLNEKFYEKQVMPAVHRILNGESAHALAVCLSRYNVLLRSRENLAEYPELATTVFGYHFNNPIGLAAGFDKNANAVENLRRCGFGFIEIGSVTPLPQPGNEKPRVFRLPNARAVINRYGFNSDGVGAVHERVRKARASGSSTNVPLGVNLGKNKTSTSAEGDYEVGASYFAPNCDYLVVNVSSPNTPGLRALQSKDELVKILQAVLKAITRVTQFEDDVTTNRPKLLLKISPDLNEADMRDVAKVCLNPRNGVDGIIISNTTITRPDVHPCAETGGLSGVPLRQLSTDCIARMYRLTEGRLPIIGCGGVESGEDAYEKILAGASLVQLYTALVYQGFPVIGRVKRELAECLRRDGFANVADAVAAAHHNDPRIKLRKKPE